MRYANHEAVRKVLMEVISLIHQSLSLLSNLCDFSPIPCLVCYEKNNTKIAINIRDDDEVDGKKTRRRRQQTG